MRSTQCLTFVCVVVFLEAVGHYASATISPDINSTISQVTMTPDFNASSSPDMNGTTPQVTMTPEYNASSSPDVNGTTTQGTMTPEYNVTSGLDVNGTTTQVTMTPEYNATSGPDVNGTTSSVTMTPEYNVTSGPDVNGTTTQVTMTLEFNVTSGPDVNGTTTQVTMTPEYNVTSGPDVNGTTTQVTMTPEYNVTSGPDVNGTTTQVTMTPEYNVTSGPDVNGTTTQVTMTPEYNATSGPDVNGTTTQVTMTPEYNVTSGPDGNGTTTQVTMTPEYNVTSGQDVDETTTQVTMTPEYNVTSGPDVNGTTTQVTMTPEYNATSGPNVNGTTTQVTMTPEYNVTSGPDVNGTTTQVTMTPEYNATSGPDVNGTTTQVTMTPEYNVTSGPDGNGTTTQVTMTPEYNVTSGPDVNGTTTQVTMTPEYSVTSGPDVNGTTTQVTMTPEYNVTSGPDVNGTTTQVTMTPEYNVTSGPDGNGTTTQVTMTPEYNVTSGPDVNGTTTQVIMTPEYNATSDPDVNGTKSQVTMTPEYNATSGPDVNGTKSQVTMTPEYNVTSSPDVNGTTSQVTITPEYNVTSGPDGNGTTTQVTMTPEYNVTSGPDGNGTTTQVTMTPEYNVTSGPDVNGTRTQVTMTPEYNATSGPDVNGTTTQVTMTPEYNVTSGPDVNGTTTQVTMTPEYNATSGPDVNGTTSQVTMTPEYNVTSGPDVNGTTSQVTITPEYNVTSGPDGNGTTTQVTMTSEYNVTSGPDVNETTTQVTMTPEYNATSGPDVNGTTTQVTMTPEYNVTSGPDVNGTTTQVTMTPEYNATSGPDVNGTTTQVTMTPEYNVTSGPDVNGTTTQVTMTPEYNVTSGPDVNRTTTQVTITPEYNATSGPDVNGTTSQVTMTPDFNASSSPDMNGTTTQVTMTPEYNASSSPDINGTSTQDTITPKYNTTSTTFTLPSTPIKNACLSNPCLNGVCENTNGGYLCQCRTGFSGDRCDSDINECNSLPCRNGGTCYNTYGSFRCFCVKGWTGPSCDNDTNECLQSGTCADHAECTNTPGSFSCKCKEGYSGDGHQKCTQTILFNTSISYSYYYAGDDEIYSFYIPGGIEYYGKRHYYAYVSMNGYITLSQRYSSHNPLTSPASWVSLRHPIIAPLWADIDTLADEPSKAGMYVNVITDKTTLNVFRNAFNDSFVPRFCLMVTWKNAAPYPYKINYKYETADFQVVLATNGSYTYIMYNYDQERFTWRRSGGRLVLVGYSDSSFQGNVRFDSNNFTEVNKGSNVGINGRWIFGIGKESDVIGQATAMCINWVYDSYIQSRIEYIRRRSQPCPCSFSQVRRDWRFSYSGYSYDGGYIYQYQERWSNWPHSHRERCHYKTRHWWQNSGSLQKGYPNGGYMESYDNELGIQDAYNNCCSMKTGLCHLFYWRNPSKRCKGYRPPPWRPANGDPHITTLDGAKYTFNGRGEYTLVELKENSTLRIQVRTDLFTVNDPDSTIFVGVAGKDGLDGDTVEILLDRELNSSIIYINGVLNNTFSSTNPTYLNIDANRVNVMNETDKIIVTFQTGLSLQITVHNLLDIVTSAPEDGVFEGNTRGLLGNNDGNDQNDYQLKNGTILSANSSEEQLFEFGSSWIISESESLFNYNVSGGTYDFFNNQTIRPRTFIRDILSNLTGYLSVNCLGVNINATAIETACGDNIACKVDAAATCNTAFGLASRNTEEQVDRENVILENFPPSFNTPSILYVGYSTNRSISMNMSALVTDESLYAVTVDTNIPSADYSFENNIFNWTVSDDLRRGNQTVYVRFTANDTLGASSVYQPDIYYCGCQRMTECDFSLSVEAETNNTDNFYTARCNCAEGKEGDLCEMDKDYCTPNPCYENVNCSNMQGGFVCGSCPTGLEGNGIRCEDANECNSDPSPCMQTCENVIGFFKCGCLGGYRLGADKSSCEDINECVDRNRNNCSATEQCINLPGSFRCECSPGYVNSASGCRKVLASYVGILFFATPEGLGNDNVIFNVIKVFMYGEFCNITEGSSFSVDVRDLKQLSTRFIRTTGGRTLYSITFILQGDTALKTSTVAGDFIRKIKTLPENQDFNYDIPFFIDSVKSKVYTDNDVFSICNITDMVECDLITTDCNSVDGVQLCPCKNGFKEFSSTTCRDIDECENANICGENGRCENSFGSYTCICDPGYLSEAGSVCTDLCLPNPCKNGGSCNHGIRNSYTCECTNGWTGINCERELERELENVENAEVARMQLVAIVVGSVVGALCVALIVVSCLLWRRYVITKLGYKKAVDDTDDTSDINHKTGLKIPRAKIHKHAHYDVYQPTGNDNNYKWSPSYTNEAYTTDSLNDDEISTGLDSTRGSLDSWDKASTRL